MNILVRADSSAVIGTGHIMRDLVLASKYKKDNIIFATQNLEGNINYKILESGYKIEILKSNDIQEVDSLIKKYNIDMIIIDSYDIDFKYEKELKDNNKSLKIFAFDDTYEKHHCDILLNHNISANKKRYKDKVPKSCELKCGSRYTLLRDEFIEQKKKKSKYKIFVAMGGADHSNINISVLKVLKSLENIEVNIVTTKANKNLDELKKYVKNKSFIKLHIDSKNIARLMRKSNLAIVTPSVTLNEIYFMEIPFIAIKTALNQQEMYEYLKEKKFMVLKKFDKKELLNKINKMRNLYV